MTDDEPDPLDPEEGRYHPRLLLLDEFDGEIQGRKKFFKSLFHLREEVDGVGKEEWTFEHDSFGPTDQGLSKLFRAYDKIGLVVVEKDGKLWIYKQTEKGSKFAKGLRRGLRILRKGDTEEREESLELVAVVNKDRSGSEIEEDWEIAKRKAEVFGIDQ